MSLDAISELSPESTVPISVSVGIFAYNEELTIQRVLERFLQQAVVSVTIQEIVVVCSGCTDGTVQIARRTAGLDPRVRIIVRREREGKVAAINDFLALARSDILLLASADVIPAPDLVERLSLPLAEDLHCAMTGPRVLVAPQPDFRRVVKRLHSLIWEFHHAVAERSPKLGEAVAVRRLAVPGALPEGVHCDEALIESLVVENGGRLRYVSSAVVYNFPPGRLFDLYAQRRRVAAQHMALRRLRGYRPSTTRPKYAAAALRDILAASRRAWSTVLLLCLLESIARLHGSWDLARGRDHQIWRMTRRTAAIEPRARRAVRVPVRSRDYDY